MTEQKQCLNCKSYNVKEEIKNKQIKYDETQLVNAYVNIKIPVMTCQDCNFSWTDHRAEYIRQQMLNSIAQG